MTFPGETVGFNGAVCGCGEKLPLRIQRSAAGFYLGYYCPMCGPYSRETGYYDSDVEAYDDWLAVRFGKPVKNRRG